MNDIILFLCAQGITSRDIASTFKELYSRTFQLHSYPKSRALLLSKLLSGRLDGFDPVYPIVYLDCIVLKIRQNKRVINKVFYLVLSVNLEGRKELLGMWISENEGAKFWLSVLTELQDRVVNNAHRVR